jgi:hypothetical protein
LLEVQAMHLVVGGEQRWCISQPSNSMPGMAMPKKRSRRDQQVFGALQRRVAVKAGERRTIGLVIARVA